MKIVPLHLNITNQSEYNRDINKIIHAHNTETEPFIIVGIYTDYNTETVPVTVQIWGTIRVWQAARNSQWVRHIVLTGITPSNNRFVRWISSQFTNEWIVYIEPDEASALARAEKVREDLTQAALSQ